MSPFDGKSLFSSKKRALPALSSMQFWENITEHNPKDLKKMRLVEVFRPFLKRSHIGPVQRKWHYLVGDDTKAICDFCNEGENRPPLSTIMVYGFIGYSPWLLAYTSAPLCPTAAFSALLPSLEFFQVCSFKVSRKNLVVWILIANI